MRRSKIPSANALTLVTTIADNFDANIVSTTTEDNTFTGTKTNVEVVSSELRLKLNGAYAASGTYDFNGTVDLGDIFTCIVKSEMTVAAFNASLSFDAALGLFDDQGGTFDINGAGSAPVSAEMFVRIKDTGGGSFGPWLPVMSSLLTFAEFKVRRIQASSNISSGMAVDRLTPVRRTQPSRRRFRRWRRSLICRIASNRIGTFLPEPVA